MSLKSIWTSLGDRARRPPTARFDGWVREHSQDLYRFAYRLGGDADTAEDLVQETFYHAWRGMAGLHDETKARAWLFQILRHRYSHLVRDASRRPRIAVSLDSVGHIADGPRGPHVSALTSLADRDELQTALDSLDERFKLPLLMVFVEGLTCQEAADTLDVPLGTVLSRIHRARRHLREVLREQDCVARQQKECESPGNPGSQAQEPRLRLGGEAI